MKIGVCGNSTIQHKYKNCYFFRKSSGIMYLALAVAPATWYNSQIKQIQRREKGEEPMTRQEQALRSRQKIIDTAMLLIEEKGYSSVTIKDICERAELSIGAFYHYFSNIAEVLFSFYNQYSTKAGGCQ